MNKPRYNTTIQFRSRERYNRLKALATINGKTIGEQIKHMVDRRMGEKFGVVNS